MSPVSDKRLVCSDQLAIFMRPPENIISLRAFLAGCGFDVQRLQLKMEEYQGMINLPEDSFQHWDDPTGFVEEMEYRDAVEIAIRAVLWEVEEMEVTQTTNDYNDDGTGAEITT
jgi:hypothetical protein